jgi:glycosyltransferase involved in cell wall biosynthesis
MRILMGIPAPWLKGGPPTHLPLLVDYLKKDQNIQIKTFYYGSRKPEGKENILEKVVNTSKVFLKFLQLLITFKPQVVHLNSAFDKNTLLRDVPFSVFCKLIGKPLFFKIHGSHYTLFETKNPVLRFLTRLYFMGASKVGVLSLVEKDEFIKCFGHASKFVVVKNIVRQPDVSSISLVLKEHTRYDALFVSRIEKGKGLEDLLNAIPTIVTNFPDFMLAVAGDGRAWDEYKNLAVNLKIEKHVAWLGHINNEDLKGIFHESRIFIFTSHFPEGMPMAMVEALLYGMPVITTRTRFALSYLKEEKNVLFIERQCPEQIAEKLSYLMNNKAMQEQMQFENVHFIQQFSQNKVGEEFTNIYLQMAG